MWLEDLYNWLVGVDVSIASDIRTLQRDVALLKLELHKTKEAQAKSLQEVRDSLLAKIGSLHGRLTNEIGSAIELIDQLRKEVFDLGMPVPGYVTIRVTNEVEGVNGMADRLTFSVDINPSDDLGDVVSSRIAVTMDSDGIKQEKVIQKGVTSADGFVGDQDGEGVVEVAHTDDAGLEGEASSQRFVLRDTKAPQRAGEVTLRVTSEEEVEEAPTEQPGEQP